MKPSHQKNRKANINSYEPARDTNERRTCCHRCGNVRKSIVECNSCPQIFCAPCAGKMQAEYGNKIFDQGCPVCREMCCCHHKTMKCKKTFHCYKKCPTARAERGLTRKDSNASLSNMDETNHASSSSTPEEHNKSQLHIDIPNKSFDPIENAPWIFNIESDTPAGIAGLARFSPYAVRNSTIKKSLFALENENGNKRKRSMDLDAIGTKKPYQRGNESPLARTIERMNPDQLKSHMDKALDTFGSDFPDISWFQQTPLSGYPLLRSLSDFEDPFLSNSNYITRHVLLNDSREDEMDEGSDDSLQLSPPKQYYKNPNIVESKASNQVRNEEPRKTIPLKFDKRPKSIQKPMEIDDDAVMLEEKPSDVLKQDKLTYSNRNPNNFSSPKNDYELNFLVSSYKQYGVVPSGSLPSLSPYVGKLNTDANSMFNSGNMMMDVSSSGGRPENFYPELFDQT